MAGLAIKGIPLREKLKVFHRRFTGYIRNAGPGIVELTVAEARELSELLEKVDEVLGKLEKLADIKQIQKNKRKKK